jgi:hypothetical protein
MKTLKMKNLFVLPNASSVYKELKSIHESGDLDERQLEMLLFKALWLLEATEAERNGLESELKLGKCEPFWEGQK